MPTYEYECRKCGHRFDAFHSITAPSLKRCPQCRGALRRLLGTGSGVIFKGSGFYTTDYRSSAYKEAAKKDSGPGTAPSDAKKDKPSGAADVKKKES
jgi:putative FmdB family regulatory protein